MTWLCSIADAHIHLRTDAADEPWLRMAIPAVSGAVIAWCGGIERISDVDSSGLPDEDSDGVAFVPDTVRFAVLVELDRRYRLRSGGDDDRSSVPAEFGHGYILGRGATELLTPWHKGLVR